MMNWFRRTPSREEVEALLTYWDDTIAQHPATAMPPAELPAGMAALVRAVNTAGATDPNQPTYEDHLLQVLLARQKAIAPMNITTATAPALSTPRAPARPALPRQPAAWVRRNAMPALEIGLIVLLILASLAGIWLTTGRDDDPRVIVPPVATPTTEASPDVPMYRGNPERTGVMPGPGIDGQPVELWRAELEGSINSAPAIVDGVLYLGAGDGGIYAFDSQTGETIWIFQGASPISSSPAVHNGLVYAGSEDGTLYALDAADGNEVWTFPGARSEVAPVVVGNALYTGSADGFLYALDPSMGEELWRAPLNEAASRSPTVAGGVVYIGSADGVLHTFDALTGEPGWTFQGEGGGSIATTAIGNGLVYQTMLGGVENSYAYALDPATGEVVWRFAQEFNPGILPPAVGNNLVYLPSADGSLYAVDAQTGDEIWRFDAGGNVDAAPALVGTTLYVAPRDGFVYALDAATGSEIWRFPVEGQASYGPVVSGGVAYVGTEFGYLYAIGGSGEPLPVVGPVQDNATPASTPVAATPESTPMAPASLATFLWETTGGPEALDRPFELTIAPDGTIWVGEAGASQFQIFGPDGSFIEAWGEHGAGNGQFNFVLPNAQGDAFGALAFAPDGSFYVMDAGNFRIQHFDANRQFLHAWGKFGTGDGEFIGPNDIVVDTQGNVFVNDNRREDVQKFGPDGTHLLTFGGSGSAPGQFDYQSWMTIDAKDAIWVADPENNRIQQFSNEGQFLAAFDADGQFSEPTSIAIDSEGRMFVTEYFDVEVIVLDPAGKVIGTWGAPVDLRIESFESIALDGEGNVYIVSYLDGKLLKFQLQPPLVTAPETIPAASPVATPVS